MTNSAEVLVDLKKAGSLDKVKVLSSFFKTKEGQYGFGDQFYGVTVPSSRLIAKKYHNLSLDQVAVLLQHPVHEARMVSLLILVDQFTKTKDKKLAQFYLKHASCVNNWDLVDLSAPKILGTYLLDKDRKVLYSLVKSQNMWERRIAIVSTYAFIRKGDFADTLKLAETLLKDKQDLMQKAVGWMLREVGKKDKEVLTAFLVKHHKVMPRTMLRYALEKYSEQERKRFMQK